MLNNKKAEVSDFVEALIAALITIVVFFSMTLVFFTFEGRELVTNEVRSEIYVAKTYYSPNVLLQKENGVAEFGMIDINKFGIGSLEKNNNYIEEYVGAQLSIIDEEGKILHGPIYNNEEYYVQHLAFAENNVRGPGGASLNEIVYPIKLSEADNTIQYLRIRMVVANDE